MRFLRCDLFRLAWLLAYVATAYLAGGNSVLCFEADGKVSLEAGACPCSEAHVSATSLGDTDARFDEGRCLDVLVLTDTHLACGRPAALSAVAVADHPTAVSCSPRRDSSVSSRPGFPHPVPTLQSFLRSTVLLI